MKKRKIIAITAVVLALFLTGCSAPNKNISQKKSDLKVTQTEKNKNNQKNIRKGNNSDEAKKRKSKAETKDVSNKDFYTLPEILEISSVHKLKILNKENSDASAKDMTETYLKAEYSLHKVSKDDCDKMSPRSILHAYSPDQYSNELAPAARIYTYDDNIIGILFPVRGMKGWAPADGSTGSEIEDGVMWNEDMKNARSQILYKIHPQKEKDTYVRETYTLSDILKTAPDWREKISVIDNHRKGNVKDLTDKYQNAKYSLYKASSDAIENMKAKSKFYAYCDYRSEFPNDPYDEPMAEISVYDDNIIGIEFLTLSASFGIQHQSMYKMTPVVKAEAAESVPKGADTLSLSQIIKEDVKNIKIMNESKEYLNVPGKDVTSLYKNAAYVKYSEKELKNNKYKYMLTVRSKDYTPAPLVHIFVYDNSIIGLEFPDKRGSGIGGMQIWNDKPSVLYKMYQKK